MDDLPVYDDTNIKIKIRIYGNKVYTNFWDLNKLEDSRVCESFTVLSIDPFLCLWKQILPKNTLRQLCL